MTHSQKQIFIIGCPRSGTTYLMRLLSSNKNFSWISNELNKSPFNYKLSKGLRFYKIPVLGKGFYLKANMFGRPLPTPVEAWNFWNSHIDYFQWKPQHCFTPRNSSPEDLDKKQIEKTRLAVESICEHSGNPIFLSKYTDFPRIKMLKKIFPDAKFIHIVRDGRAVANSYTQKIKSGDFNTSKEIENWMSAWPKEWQNKFIELEKNPIAFTFTQWMFFVSQIKSELNELPKEDHIEIKYSQLTRDQDTEIDKLLSFCDLKMDSNMKYFMKTKPSNDMNFKWKEKLSEEEKYIFKELLMNKEMEAYLDK